jgi:hypothetical protein
MDYTGLLPTFKVDRPLSDEERQLQLKQGVRLDVDPIYQLAVVRINSTYLETTDKFYAWKGWLTLGMCLVGLVVAGFLVLATADAWTSSHAADLLDWSELRPIHGLVLFWGLGSPLLLAIIWLLRREAFRHTHYPLRFNRKTRMVHAFRYDGSILSAKWDDLFFTLGRGNRSNVRQNWDIRMHVLDGDRATVRETLSLGMDMEDQDLLRRFWELHRRYMEEGPQAVARVIEVFMPVNERREGFVFGMRRWWGNFLPMPAAYFLIAPVVPLVGLARWFAMQTSKVPVWPKEIEAACAVESDDPYRRDARDNPTDMFGSRA